MYCVTMFQGAGVIKGVAKRANNYREIAIKLIMRKGLDVPSAGSGIVTWNLMSN